MKRWLIHIPGFPSSPQVIQGPTSNGCTLWRYLHNVLYSIQLLSPGSLCFIFILHLYLIEGLIDTAQCLKSCCCLWNEGVAWTYRSSWSVCVCVCSGACSRTLDTDREEDRSDLTWQDVLRHDMLIWQQTQALRRWTSPRTYISSSFISFGPFPHILSFPYLSVFISLPLFISVTPLLISPPSLTLPHPPYLPTPSAKAELVL